MKVIKCMKENTQINW